MAKEILDMSVNEIKDLAVADFASLTNTIQELKSYQLIALGKKLAVPRYSVLRKEDLFRAILNFLSTEESEFAAAIVPPKEEAPAVVEPVKEISFQLLTNTALEERSYPANTPMNKILAELNMENKTVAVQGELIPKHRLTQTIEQLGVEGTIVAVITKTANA